MGFKLFFRQLIQAHSKKGGIFLALKGRQHTSPGLDGWGLFSDDPVRKSHPLLSVPMWKDVLHENGFQQVTSIQTEKEDHALFPQGEDHVCRQRPIFPLPFLGVRSKIAAKDISLFLVCL